MNTNDVYVVMPVKDSFDTVNETARAIVNTGATLTIYNDYSTTENTLRLHQLAQTIGCTIIDLEHLIQHPSPNYRTTLQHAQDVCLKDNKHLLIIESDVWITEHTIPFMIDLVRPGIGMIAAVTENENGIINFPYLYAKHLKGTTIETSKRLSFCCTLLTQELLQKVDFQNLDSNKDWYDVLISHQSRKLGLINLLMLNNRVLHRPHGSRPWKKLKYSNPLLYYWRKLILHKDRI